MKSSRPLGIIWQKETGEIIYVPINSTNDIKSSNSVRSEGGETGKIVRSPTPEEARIAQEKKVDYTLKGRLKKYEVSEKELQK